MIKSYLKLSVTYILLFQMNILSYFYTRRYNIFFMLPLAAIERVVRKAGVKRISQDALKEIQRYIDELGEELVFDIAEITRHTKRKTIKKEDVLIGVGKK